MNKFSFGLHSALFSLDGDEPSRDYFGYGVDSKINFDTEVKQMQEGVKVELIDLANGVIDALDYSTVITEVVNSKKNTEKFEENMARFYARMGSKNTDGVKYAEVWNARIGEGFKRLVNELEKARFFEGCDDEASKTERLKDVKVRYFNEVKDQYSKNVWDASEEEFDKIKDNLFKVDSSDNPVTKILKAFQYTNDKRDDTKIDESIRESYSIETDISEETINNNIESVKNRRFGKKQHFLSEDLPNYFLRIKGKKWVGKSFETIGKFLGITKIDRASEEDKDAIEDFLDVVEDIADEGKKTPEEALNVLMDLLKNGGLTVNSTKSDYKKAMDSKNIKGDGSDIMKVGKMYLKTAQQGNSPENQHNIYYAVVQLMDKEGIDRTIAMFKDEVEIYQKNKEMSNEKAGKQLKEKDAVLFNISDKFNKNYNSALRLAERSEESFQYEPVVDILADLNNDGYVRYSDNGVTKTGLQFKRIVSIYGEDRVLEDLLNQAKKLNKAMNLGLNEEDFNTDEIQKGNKKLILLLQSVISHPGGDLATLIGLDDNKREEIENLLAEAPKDKEDPRVQKAAEELTKNIKLGEVNIPGVKVATEEGLRQAVAGALYTDYMRGIGAGADISFEKWSELLSLNRGAQVTDKGVGVGLSLEYSQKIDLGKGWSVTPGGAIGFIGVFSDEKTGLGFIAGASVDVAKEWINKNSEQLKAGLTLSGNINVMKGSQTPTFIAYAGLHWDRDKLAGIEKDREKVESEFKDKVMTPLVKGISESLGDKRLNLDDPEVEEKVKKAIGEQINTILSDDEKSRIDNMDRERVVDNVIRFLSFYHDYDLSQEVFREEIVKALSKQCSLARENDRLQSIDGNLYISHASAGIAAVWVLGSPVPVPVVHIGLGGTKHEKDGYVDKYFGKHEIEIPSQFQHRTKREQDMIDDFNKYLPEEGKKLKLEKYDGIEFIVVPKTLLKDVYVSTEMKGLMKKDEKGNVLLDLQTYIDWPTLYIGSSTESVRINVGGYSDNMQNLATLADDWFTKENINTEALPGKDFMVTQELLDVALNDLKITVSDDKYISERIRDFNFQKDFVEQHCTEKNKKYTIILDDNGRDIIPRAEPSNGKGVVIEYRGHKSVDLVSEEAQNIAKTVYEEANKVKSNELRNISHIASHKLYPEYRSFALAVKDQRYDEAKDIILKLLPKMDKAIGKYQPKGQVEFNKIAPTLQNLDGAELGKALMSINNVFARVAGVRGGTEGEYSFEYGGKSDTMDTVIKSRAKQIKSRIDSSNGLDVETKNDYKNLIDFMESYRVQHSTEYKTNSKKTKTLENAIGINLGNPISIENPLFNPEVYEDSIVTLKTDEIKFEGKDNLYGRILEVIAGNKTLISPILQALGIDENANINKITYDNGQINIDIDEKNVILKANMKIAYFAQCVNHMLIMDNIHAEIEGEGRSVNFGARVSDNGQLYEGTGGTTYSTVKTDVHIAAALNKTPEPEEPTDDPGSDPDGGEDDSGSQTGEDGDDGPIGGNSNYEPE